MPRTTQPVVPVGTMANVVQPVITIDAELMLRPFTAEDSASVIEAFSTADIQHYHSRVIETEKEALEWIEYSQQDWLRERSATWAVIAPNAGEFLGRVSIKTNLGEGWGEIAYWMLPAARGRRVATRASIAATSWAHGLGLHRIELEHSVKNESSRRVALAAGFVKEGVKRSSVLHDDGWHDMVLYSCLASDRFRIVKGAD